MLTDVWLNAPRWWRFAVLIPLLVPYALAEELALGPPAEGWRARSPSVLLGAGRRFALFLLLRLVLWLGTALGLFVLLSGEILVVLLAVYLAAFSIAQRLGADALRRRTGSAAAAAVFSAILAAWFIAAVFPIQ
jgi:hypothetical protein